MIPVEHFLDLVFRLIPIDFHFTGTERASEGWAFGQLKLFVETSLQAADFMWIMLGVAELESRFSELALIAKM